MGSEWAMGWFRDGEIAKQQTCKLVAVYKLRCNAMQYISCHHAPVGSKN